VRIPLPLFFVSVASKRFSVSVRHLKSTLTDWFVNVDSKRFKFSGNGFSERGSKQK
jgi:hypothetical protein